MRAEEDEMAPERAGVAVVKVCDGFAEVPFQTRADIETGPSGMREIGRTFSAEDPGGTGGAGSVETYGHDFAERYAGFIGGDFEAVGNLRETDVGTFTGAGGMLAEAFDEEMFVSVDEGVVDGGSAKIDSCDKGSGCGLHGSIHTINGLEIGRRKRLPHR
jgi:hypothetical protein